MRIISLFLIFFLMSSCGGRAEKSASQKEASQKEETLKQEYLLKGGEIANLSQSELLKNVSMAMKKGGPGYAIEFCNLHALALKDSLSCLNNCQIQRIASKYRNPEDRPKTEKEKEQLDLYQIAFQKGESLKAEVHLYSDRVEYYQPIMIAMEACLKCHGDPGKQIAEETIKEINARYPDDLATGFAMNDFRGAWKITFPQNQDLKENR